MERDPGTSVSLISQTTKRTLFSTAVLAKKEMKLHTYTAEPIRLLGKMRVKVPYKDYRGWHDLYVVEGEGYVYAITRHTTLHLLFRLYLSDRSIRCRAFKKIGGSPTAASRTWYSVKKGKMPFSVGYLGHQIDAHGL